MTLFGLIPAHREIDMLFFDDSGGKKTQQRPIYRVTAR